MKIPVIFCPKCDHLIWDSPKCDQCHWQRTYDDLGLGKLYRKWELDSKIERGPSSLVVTNDHHIVTCDHKGNLVGINATNDKPLWSRQLLPDTIISGLAAYGNKVVVTLLDTNDTITRDMKIAIVDAHTGQELDKFNVRASSLSVPTVESDTVFFAAAMETNAVAFALDLRTSNVRWKERISQWHRWPPLIVDQTVWFGIGTPVLQGFPLSGLDNAKKVRELHPGDTALFIAAGQHDDIFVVSDDWTLYQVDTKKDTILYACSEAHKYTSPPNIGDGTLYIGALGKQNRKPELHKYAIAPQEIRYPQTLALRKQTSQPPLLFDDTVIVVDDAGNLEILEQRTGKRQLQIATQLRTCTQPVIAGDLVFLAGRDGEVQARYWRQPTQLSEAPSFYEQKKEWDIAGVGYTLQKDWPNAACCFEKAQLWQRAFQIYQCANDLGGMARMRNIMEQHKQPNHNYNWKAAPMNPEMFLKQKDADSLLRVLITFGEIFSSPQDRRNVLVNAGLDKSFINRLNFDRPNTQFANTLLANFRKHKVSEGHLDYHPMLAFLSHLLKRPQDYGLEDHDISLCTQLVEQGKENLKALQARSSVGRIESPRGTGIGTGVLVGESLLLTCQHVFNNKCLDLPAWVRFRYTDNSHETDGYVFELDIQSMQASGQPDYALVKIKGKPQQQIARPVHKTLSSGLKIQMIHHPHGQHVVISDVGKIVKVGEEYIAHNIATADGSSGAPIFDRDWELVAIHRGQPGIEHHASENTTEGVPIHAIWDKISPHLS